MGAIKSSTSGGVLSIELNRPEKLNALDADMIEDFGNALAEIDRPQSGVKVVLLTGAGRSFCAGADKTAIGQIDTEDGIRRHANGLKGVFLSLAEAKVPVITAVQGHALGAGCGLVTASTITIAAHDAQFGYPEMASGILPALVTPLLMRCVGVHRARALLLSSKRFTTEQAVAIGLVDVSSISDPREAAAAMAHRLASLPDDLAPILFELLENAERLTLREALDEAGKRNIASKLDSLSKKSIRYGDT